MCIRDRSYLVHSLTKKENQLLFVGIALFMTVVGISLNRFLSIESIEQAVQFGAQYFVPELTKNLLLTFMAVSYTHLDVYKRQVDIHLDIEGKHELLTNTQKMALYRIICEGIGNGLRHGKAKAINITLGIDLDLITLTIRDNGRGFDYKRFMNSKQGGLGIKNMNYLVQSLQGDLQFYSCLLYTSLYSLQRIGRWKYPYELMDDHQQSKPSYDLLLNMMILIGQGDYNLGSLPCFTVKL